MDELKRIERRAFSHKNSQREKRVLGVSIATFSSSRFEKSIHSGKAGGEKELPKRELSTKKKELKKEDEKARTESFIFPSKQKERKTTYSYKRE